MTRKTIATFLLSFLLFPFLAVGQTAREVLDKCAAAVSNAGGVEAQFTMSSAQYGQASGTISVKGRKFCAATNVTTMWFDGTTLWTYVPQNDEVSVTTPTEQQLQLLNPYNFISLYRDGYKYTMTQSAASYIVHLTAKEASRRIQELFVTVSKNGYAPVEVRLLQKQKWTTFTISGFRASTLPDGKFRFDASKYPDAEVIDLR